MTDIAISLDEISNRIARVEKEIAELEVKRLHLVKFHDAVSEYMGKEKRSWKNVNASKLGKIGGSKGGKKRASNLTAEQRKSIASKAAKKRWNK